MYIDRYTISADDVVLYYVRLRYDRDNIETQTQRKNGSSSIDTVISEIYTKPCKKTKSDFCT